MEAAKKGQPCQRRNKSQPTPHQYSDRWKRIATPDTSSYPDLCRHNLWRMDLLQVIVGIAQSRVNFLRYVVRDTCPWQEEAFEHVDQGQSGKQHHDCINWQPVTRHSPGKDV